MSLLRVGLLLGVASTVLLGQMPLHDAAQIETLNSVIRGELRSDPLNCGVQTFRPFLDFAFRYEAGYVIHCALDQFRGKGTGLAAYLRIAPEGKPPVYLGESFRMPELPSALRDTYNWKKLHAEAEFSGVFAAGAGKYPVDLVVIDEAQRIFRKSWEVKISPDRSERKTEIVMAPDSAASAAVPSWPSHDEPTGAATFSQNGEVTPSHHRHDRTTGPQLTVLLDAAPVFPSSTRLRAWDRAFLMSSLTSLLRSLQPSRVRLVAFNLEQQREIYHQEMFTRSEFPKLAEALRQLELGTVSYKALASGYGSADLLRNLVTGETRGDRLADAVIFLGPNLRNYEKIPRELLPCQALNARLHYLEFFSRPGSEFPDTIHNLTNTCHGSVYRMHSPADLADALAKLQERIQPAAATAIALPSTLP